MSQVGYAVLPVILSTRGLKKQLQRDVFGQIAKGGKSAQNQLSRQFKSAFAEMEKAAQKAQTVQEKATKAVERAEADLQKKRESNAKKQETVAKREETLAKARQKYAADIAAAEKRVSDLRQQGKTHLVSFGKAEEKLAKLRAESPEKLLKKEVSLKKARDAAKDSANKLKASEKAYQDAVQASAKATREAASAQDRLTSKEGISAKRKDLLKQGLFKLEGAYHRVDRAVGTTASALGRLSGRAISTAIAGVGRLSASMGRLSASVARSLGGAALGTVQRFGSAISTAMKRGTQAITAAGAAISGAALLKGFNRLSAIEGAEVKFKTFGVNATQAMEQANAAVKGTAFGLDEAATATANLSAAGIKMGQQMSQSLGLIGDTAALTGASFSEIQSIYSKIAATGKLDGETLDQLQDRGVAVLKAISDASGMTQQEVRKAISDGKISYQEFADAMEQSIGGAAKRSGETVKGSFANLGAALGRFGASMQENTFEVLPQVFGNLTEAVDKVSPSIVAATEGMRTSFAQTLVSMSESILQFSGRVPAAMQTISQSPGFVAIKTAVDSIKTSIVGASPALGAMVSSTVLAGFTVLGQAAQAAAGSIAAIKQNSEISAQSVQTRWSGVLSSITSMTGQAFAAIPGIVAKIAASPVWGTIGNAISKVFSGIRDLAPSLGAVAAALGSGAWKIASAIFSSIGTGIQQANVHTIPFAQILETKIVPWIGTMTDKISALVTTHLPGLVTLLMEKVPQAFSVIASDPNFVKARENMVGIVKGVISLAPELAKLAGSGALIGLTLMNNLLNAVAPVLTNVVIPGIAKLAQVLAENSWAAKLFLGTMATLFIGGKIVTGITTMVTAVTSIKTAFTGAKAALKLFNLGFLSSPWGIAITGITAVVAVLHTFFTKTEVGRKAWNKFTSFIKVGWEQYAKPTFSAIGKVIGWLFNNIVKPYFNGIKTVIVTAFKAVAWYVNNVIKPALQTIGKVIVWLYKNIVKPNFAAISAVFKAFGQASRAMGGVIKSVFSTLGSIIKGGVSIARKAIGMLRGSFQSAADKARNVKDTVSGAFGRMADAVSGVKDKIVRIIDSIKRAWKSMVDLVSKPIKAGVEGAKRLFGRGKEGGRSRYASGGVLPGYTPGRDVHHYINPKTGHILSLSGGEAIMRPEWVKQQGGSSAIDRMNRFASRSSGRGKNSTRRSRFASGGVVRFMNQLGAGTGNISIENPTIKTSNANIESDDATVNAKEQVKQQVEEGISSRKTMADLRADLYAKQHKGEVGQAIAEQMKAQAAVQELNEKLNFALRSGESSGTIDELRMQLKLAGADVQAASESIKEATKAEAERAREELKTKLQEQAQYRSSIRDKNAELFDAKNFDNPISMLNSSVKKAKNALLDAQDAVDIARKTGASRKEIKILEKDVKIAQANVQRAEKERIQGIEEENKKRREAATEAADEQTKFYVNWFDGLQDMGDALSSAFKNIADIGRGVKETLNNAVSSVQAFGEAWNSMISASTEIRKAERNLARVRADSADKILEAQKEIKKQAKQNLRLVSTAPANLKISAEIDRTTTTLQRLGGTFTITADEMKRREATIAEARAQAALDSAQAEYELKKARIDGAKAIVEQRKATQMLNNSLQEYILKARLINGMSDRDTNSLEKFFEGFSQKTKGEALLMAAAQELKIAQMSGNAVKAQEAMAKMYEGQQARALGTYQMQVYNKEATKAFSKLPREMSQGLKDAMHRDAVLTASAVQQALSRGDFASAAAVARNAGKVTSAFMQTVVGFRTIQDDLISRNAQYDRDRINFENQLNSMVLDGASARLDNSSKKTQEALQAQLDAAQATRRAAESDNLQQRNVWNDFARQSERDYRKLASEARAYNAGGSETVVINIPEGQNYSSQEVADYMTQATKRIDAIEVRLDGTRASGSDYFAAH